MSCNNKKESIQSLKDSIKYYENKLKKLDPNQCNKLDIISYNELIREYRIKLSLKIEDLKKTKKRNKIKNEYKFEIFSKNYPPHNYGLDYGCYNMVVDGKNIEHYEWIDKFDRNSKPKVIKEYEWSFKSSMDDIYEGMNIVLPHVNYQSDIIDEICEYSMEKPKNFNPNSVPKSTVYDKKFYLENTTEEFEKALIDHQVPYTKKDLNDFKNFLKSTIRPKHEFFK